MTAPREGLAYVAVIDPERCRPDALAVLDVDPQSAAYGRVVGRLDLPYAGDELHHFGWNACSAALCPTMPHPHLERRYLLVPGLRSSRVYVVDTKLDPRQPRMLNLTAERYGLANSTDSPVFVNTSPLYIYWPAVLGVVLLLSGIGLLFTMARNWKTAAAVYEHGLALYDPTGLWQFRWDAVDEVRQSVTNYYRNGVYMNTVYVYTMRTRDGQTLKFNNRFAKIEQLGNAIQRHVADALLPRYVEALSHGQRLSFGPIAIDRQRLCAGDRSLPWPEIKALKLQNDHIAIRNESDWFNWVSISLPQVPNLWVFSKIAGLLTSTE